MGYGYVGSAVASIFDKKEVIIIDPRFNNNKIKDYKGSKFNIVFVCVDTPKNEKYKTLFNVLVDIEKYLPGSLVCCKSTASPSFYKNCLDNFKKINLTYSPEYLSHWNNIYDFKNQEFIIVGGKKKNSKKIINILKQRLKKIKICEFTDIETAALVKYSENAFLAYKVTFANEMYMIHKKLKLKSPFKEFSRLLTLDKRIGKSHFQVPGRDGKYGWGGHCFDKDIFEFKKFSKSKLLSFLLKINKKHRKT